MISRIPGTASRMRTSMPCLRVVHHAAALAAAAQLDVGHVVLDLEQRHPAAVLRHRGIDLLVEHPLDRERPGLGPQRVGVLDLEAAAVGPLHEIDRRAGEVRGAVRVHQQLEAVGLDHRVVGGALLLRHEVEAVLEALGSAARDRRAQRQVRAPLGLEQLEDLAAGGRREGDHGRSLRTGDPVGSMTMLNLRCASRSAASASSGRAARANRKPR